MLQSRLHLFTRYRLQISRSEALSINNFETVTMATASITNFDPTFLDNSVFVFVNHLSKQHKRTNLGKIYNELIKTIDSENTSKEHLHDRINELIIQENIINKPNRNTDSYRLNKSAVDFNIEQLEYSNLPASDFSLATPNINSHLPLIS